MKIFELIDQAHAQDPEIITVDGEDFPKELLYSNRMTECLLKFHPQADNLQIIGAKCQHLFRWEIPRKSYPMNKKGYYQWRIFLYDYQAKKAAELMEQCNYSEEEINQVKLMVSKSDLKNNSSAQLLEDVACLVFVSYYLAEFADGYDEEKMIAIIKRTWNKMSEKAHSFALALEHSPSTLNLLKKALS